MVKRILVGFVLIALDMGLAEAQDEPGSRASDLFASVFGDAPERGDPEGTNSGYIIGAQDQLLISVWNEPDLTLGVFVRPDGMIGVPLLNDVQASGLTPLQVQASIEEGLSEFVATPQVSVIVTGINSQIVYLHGGVAGPGVYPLGRPTTVMEMLIEAGGFAEFADEKKVQILRFEGESVQRIPFNARDFLEGKDYDGNILLQSGDYIIVPD